MPFGPPAFLCSGMHDFDVMVGGWDATCQASGARDVMSLSAFRRVDRLAGPGSPPAYVIRYRCGCGDEHQVLMSGTELDWWPVTTPFPPHYDLMTGRTDWASEGGPGLWWRSMCRGNWPLTFGCHHHPHPVPGWPSCLRALEPDREPLARSLLVHYTCPLCERPGSQVMEAGRLSLVPRPGKD